jgi:hypothetical protein
LWGDPAARSLHPDVALLVSQVVATEQAVVLAYSPDVPAASRDRLAPIRGFLGLPLISADRLVAVIGVSAPAVPYEERIAELLQPLLSTCASIVESCRLPPPGIGQLPDSNRPPPSSIRSSKRRRWGSWRSTTGGGSPAPIRPPCALSGSRRADRFFRGSLAQLNEIQGTGLGLAIVDAVVKRSSGQLEITSQVGEGITVQLRFPSADGFLEVDE